MATYENRRSLKNYDLQTSSIWSFPKRGEWATHKGDYPGNWSPHIPRNLILRYTQPGETVLDCFAGSGTTVIEAQLLNRPSIAVDISPEALVLTAQRLPISTDEVPVALHIGDARHMPFVKEESVDLACVHPPYANAISYSKDPADLSLLSPEPFVQAMHTVARELFRKLRADGHCALLIGDVRRNRHVKPLGFWTLNKFIGAGFILKEIVIKTQHNCRSTGLWQQRSQELNFLLLAHEYLFIFRRPHLSAPSQPKRVVNAV